MRMEGGFPGNVEIPLPTRLHMRFAGMRSIVDSNFIVLKKLPKLTPLIHMQDGNRGD